MSVLRWQRLSVLWKHWMFNQEPAEEPGQLSEDVKEDGLRNNDSKDSENFGEPQTLSLDSPDQKCEVENKNFTSANSDRKVQKSEVLKRSISEPCSQVPHSQSGSACRPRRPAGRGSGSRRSCCSEEAVGYVLQVDNGSEGDDSFLQREGSQRRSRRRFRRVNPKGERELITDGQEPAGYNTVRSTYGVS